MEISILKPRIMKIKVITIAILLIASSVSIADSRENAYGLYSSNQQYADSLLDDIFNNISTKTLISSGFSKKHLKNSPKLIEFSKEGTKALFFINGEKEILIKSYINSNNIFEKKYHLIGISSFQLAKRYKISVTKDIVNAVDNEGFTEVKLHFKNKVLISIETNSRLD